MQAAELARSYQIQADLNSIEKNRALAAQELLSQWQNVLDPSTYDLFDELGSIVDKVPAWQLYGASKTSDFSTMLGILRGRIPAGLYINGEINSASPVPQVVGDQTNELVYTPIAPCRVVDTRGSGARTGILAAGATRTFDLESDAFTSGQGGAGPCAGLPAFSHLGWAVNITTTGQTGNGWLTVYPAGGALPAASTINFSVGQWSLANGLNLTGCLACADDITVQAAAAGTHVIIDVVGFFSEATSASGPASVTRIAGTPQLLAAGNESYVDGGACPAGTTLTAGEVAHGGFDVAIGENRRSTGTVWTAWMINRDGVGRTITVTSVCLDNPVVF
jgi:hypothetical protein